MLLPLTRRAWLLLGAGSIPTGAASPRFEQVDLFHEGDNGVHTYRIPALLETRRGTLLAVVDARHDSSRDLPARISLFLRRSHDRGRTWSPAQILRQVAEGGVGDASLLLDRRTGRIWCFHNYGPPGIGWATAQPGAVTGPHTYQVHAIRSDDDGQTWSPPEDLTPQIKDPAWRAMFATSGTHFQTSRGRYLVPTVVRDATGIVASHNSYSDDAGRTWKIGPAIGAGTDESKAVELADGTVLQNMRNGKTRATARSHDGGVTFGTVANDAALIDPICNAGLARYQRRRRDLLVFTNAAAPQRRNLTVKLSLDAGLTWPRSRALHPGPAAYSTVIPLRDGTLAMLYECGENGPYERITFARFDLDWVLLANP
ncbi:MAG TPA: sialidase family protein [Bryobacteraceae bacterium]|nr:sialidase family protein [Bryobacteraceae bacterium]